MENVFATDVFLESVYNKAVPRETMADCEKDRLNALQNEKRSALYDCLAMNKLYEMFPDSKAFRADMFTLQKEEQFDGYKLLRYQSEVLPALLAPFYVFVPDNPIPDTAMVFCCGHGNGAEEYAIPDEAVEEEFYHKRFPIRAVKAGYTVCMSEFMAFGDMKRDKYKAEFLYGTSCYGDMTYLQECGLTLLGLRVHQTFMSIAFARTLASKVFLGGISGGGTVTMLTAALCEGLAGAAVMGYANMFRTSVLAMHHCICNFLPGLLSIGEEPEILSLAAPMPILFTSGDEDDIFPIHDSIACFEAVRSLYARFNAEADVEMVAFGGKHEVVPEAVIEWLNRCGKS